MDNWLLMYMCHCGTHIDILLDSLWVGTLWDHNYTSVHLETDEDLSG